MASIPFYQYAQKQVMIREKNRENKFTMYRDQFRHDQETVDNFGKGTQDLRYSEVPEDFHRIISSDVYNDFLSNKKKSLRLAYAYKHLMQLGELADGHFRPDTVDYQKIANCHNDVVYSVVGGKLKAYGFGCGNRFCPLCAYDESRRRYQAVMNNVEAVEKDYKAKYGENSKLQFVFITHTIPSVYGDQLRQAMNEVDKCVNKAYQVSDKVTSGSFGFSFLGLIRSWEITYNRTTHKFHPHLHILALCKPGYFDKDPVTGERSKLYLDNSLPEMRFAYRWNCYMYGKEFVDSVKTLEVNKDGKQYWKYPANGQDIRAVSSNLGDGDFKKCVAELAKYPCKCDGENGIFEVKGDEFTEVVKWLHTTKRKPFFVGKGVFNQILHFVSKPAENPAEEKGDENEVPCSQVQEAGEFRILRIDGYREIKLPKEATYIRIFVYNIHRPPKIIWAQNYDDLFKMDYRNIVYDQEI